MDSTHARRRMVEAQIVRRGVHDPAVLDAMRTVFREAFIGAGFEEFAYEDSALPIAEGQTISQPYIVGAMLAAAELEKTDKVLEVGAGSGYAAAVLSRISGKVFAIERHALRTEAARERMTALGYDNVELKTGDGSAGRHRLDGDMEIKRGKPSRSNSVERLCHDSDVGRFLLDFGRNPLLTEQLAEPRLQRFIGVIYRPETELQSHYADASLSRQFDAYLWFDETRAVEEIGRKRIRVCLTPIRSASDAR